MARMFAERYLLESEISAGGSSTIYRAVDQQSEQQVALQVWHDTVAEDSSARASFDEQGAAWVALNHPNLAAVTRFGFANDQPYLVLTALEGEVLSARLEHAVLDQFSIEELMVAVLQGLAYMHGRSLVHGNVCADSVFLRNDSSGGVQPKLWDFRLVTQAAVPELALDARDDVSAAGALLLHMLSRGRSRHAADEAAAELASPAFDALIAQATAPDRGARFEDAGQMLTALLATPAPWFYKRASERSAKQAPEVEVLALSKDDERAVTDGRRATYASRLRRWRTPAALLSSVALAALSLALWRKSQHETASHTANAGAPAPVQLDAAPAPAAGAPASNAAVPGAAGQSSAAEPTDVPSPQLVLTSAAEPELPGNSLWVMVPPALEDQTPAVFDAVLAAKDEAPPVATADAVAEPFVLAPVEQPEAPATVQPPEAALQANPAANGEPERNTAPAAAPAPQPETTLPPSAAERASEHADGSERHVVLRRADIVQLVGLVRAPTRPRAAQKDPWSGVLPTTVSALRHEIETGVPGSGRHTSALRRFNSHNPSEVYGHLLLAGLYMNRGWSLDALDEYEMAYQIDPSSRGAPEVLANVLTMIVKNDATSDAARFIAHAYRREALTAIQETLHTPKLEADAALRLKKLRSQLLVGGR